MMDRARYEDLAVRLHRIREFRQQVLDVQVDPETAMSAESTKRVAEELETQLSMSMKAPGAIVPSVDEEQEANASLSRQVLNYLKRINDDRVSLLGAQAAACKRHDNMSDVEHA